MHLDRDRVSGIRTRHQQTAEELAGDVAAHGAETPVQAARLDRDGRAARSQVAAGSDTQVAEGRKQVGDRAWRIRDVPSSW